MYFFRWCRCLTLTSLDLSARLFSKAFESIMYFESFGSISISSINCRMTFPLYGLIKSIMESISLSFIPFRSTIFSFTGVSPASTALSMPLITFSREPGGAPVIDSYFSGIRESRLMFTLSRPAAFRFFARCSSSIPFVVAETSLRGGRQARISSKSFRKSGSPPENLTLQAPNFAASLTIPQINSGFISCPIGPQLQQSAPSLWQYIHERLHLSVMEIRSPVTFLP